MPTADATKAHGPHSPTAAGVNQGEPADGAEEERRAHATARERDLVDAGVRRESRARFGPEPRHLRRSSARHMRCCGDEGRPPVRPP